MSEEDRDPTATDPKLRFSVPPLGRYFEHADQERRDGDERRGTGNPYKGRKVVALPVVWALTSLFSVLAGVFWMGYNWASALRELEDLHRAVTILQTTLQAGTEHRSSLDSEMAVLQKQIEWEHDRVGRLEARIIRERDR